MVEKLVYVLWKPTEVQPEGFRRTLLEVVGPKLGALGARSVSLNVADDAAARARGIRITRLAEPMAATLSIWLDTALDRGPVEEFLTAHAPKLAGYLVLESVPIVNTRHVASPGERVPGITTVAFLEVPEGMAYGEWLERWQGDHTRVAIETQSTFSYVQNVIVRALTKDAPPWSAIVEEAFPAEAATDPMVFYDARGSEERLEENRRRMIESCRRFIDFERIESHPMSTWVVR